MPIDPKKKDETDETETPIALTREDVQSMVNGAFKDSQKRTEKLIEGALAKFAEALPKPADPEETQTAGGKGAPAKESVEYKALQKQLADMQKKVDDAEKARRSEAEARRQDSAKADLRRAFEAANVRPEALDVLVAAATVNGMLRFDEDGKPVVAVKRSRAKDAAADEQVFDDFRQGVTDWTKAPEAAAFMKANTNTSTTPGKRPSGGPVPTYTKEPASEEEAVDRVKAILAGADSA